MQHNSLDSGFSLSRRALLRSSAALGVSTLIPTRLFAQGAGDAFEAPRHGFSIFGDLKYRADFAHFDYVNPEAPKGGEFAQQINSISGNQNFTTFDTLNTFTMKGNGAAGMGLIYDSLMAGSLDEPDSMYGLVAKSVQRSADGLTYRFTLRSEARFHDGSPLTAADVVFSIETLKSEKAHTSYRLTLRQVAGVSAPAPDVVEVRFLPGRSREMPLVVAGLPIFSKAYYTTRDFEAATLESPLGSGAYKVEKVDVGRSIRFARVPDYWGRDLPVNRGQGNFAFIRYEYFREREAAFQAFSAGDFTFREENSSVFWATRYDFPAVKEGRVKISTMPDERPSGTQGWFLNTRRPQFADPRVREAVGLAMDFEWINRNLMYGIYKRTTSYFENSPMKAMDKPGPEELALLEPFRGKIPDEVFGEPYTPPVSDGSGQDRAILRRATQLLNEAGAKRGSDGVLRLPDGTALNFEFLEYDGALTKHVEAIIKNLKLLGIGASIRQVDASQYQRRMQEFDYDVASARFVMSLAPGDALKLYFGSEAAKTPGSRNLAGIANPAIDAMIERVIAAKTRDDLTFAARALDRLLRAGRYWMSAWYSGEFKLAHWDIFGQPGPLPPLAGSAGGAAAALWWLDSEKAAKNAPKR